jgi:hypothetical protein
VKPADPPPPADPSDACLVAVARTISHLDSSLEKLKTSREQQVYKAWIAHYLRSRANAVSLASTSAGTVASLASLLTELADLII